VHRLPVLRGRLAERGLETLFVNLSLPAARILAPERARAFTPWERTRIAEMIAQGYDRRPWADLHFEPADAPVGDNLSGLLAALTRFGIAPPDQSVRATTHQAGGSEARAIRRQTLKRNSITSPSLVT
jgi:hypothetical protein